MDAALLALLRATNPWLERPREFAAWVEQRRPPAWLPRRVPATTEWPVAGKAHLLIGARQVGKSSFLRQFLHDRGDIPLVVNAEELAVRAWARSAGLAANDLQGMTSPGTPVFIEEAQHLEDAGLFIKGLVDIGVPNTLYVTGSSAYHLHSRTRESLAGRAVRAMMHPLSLAEIQDGIPPSPPLLRAARLREQALEMTVFGGYPEVLTTAGKGPSLTFLLESFIIRDASDFFRIQHIEAFRKLLLLVATQTGSLVNLSEWAGLAGVSRDTVQSYLSLLVESQVLQWVSPFVGGKRAELTHQPKIYFCDNGIRNAVVRRFEPLLDRVDRGGLFESWVGGELRKHLDPLHPMDALRYWRSTSKAEVDFVVERQEGLFGFECKASALMRPELSRSARSFIQAYRPHRFVVINLALSHEETVEGCRVLWRPPEWLVAPFSES